MRTCAVLLLAAFLSSCTRVEASRGSVQVDMANVDLHITDDVTLHVRQMRGRFDPVERQVPYLDDKRTYSVTVDTGEIAIDLASLNALMARSMGGDKSNIEKLRVSIENGTLRQQGVIDSAINVPFKATSVVSATADGRIRVSTQTMRGFGVSMRPVMKLFSVELDDLVKIKPGSGVQTDGNDLIVDPAVVIPAPSVRGPLKNVRIEGNQLVQTFGSGPGKPIARHALSRNHIYWQGSEHPAAERDKVFQPFYRVLGTEVDGSGLGLAIVREIADQHGAQVTLEDANLRHRPGLAEHAGPAFGPGARFTLRFAAASGA